MQLVFVYGTLLRGEANHHWLQGAACLGEASLQGLVLHNLGPFPMATAGDGLCHGEIYAVDGAGLARLDQLEGVPRLYRRERWALDDGRWVWVYLGTARQVRHSPRLPHGRWREASTPPPAD